MDIQDLPAENHPLGCVLITGNETGNENSFSAHIKNLCDTADTSYIRLILGSNTFENVEITKYFKLKKKYFSYYAARSQK